MKNENIDAVEAYLNSLKNRDLSSAPFADDIYFEDPVAGTGRGAENFKAFLSGFLPAINGYKVHQHICEGEYVVTYWDVDTTFGIIPILEKFRVLDGRIIETVAFFDPRPIIGS